MVGLIFLIIGTLLLLVVFPALGRHIEKVGFWKGWGDFFLGIFGVVGMIAAVYYKFFA